MADVILVYERTCPNVRAARANLVRAFSEAGLPATWREVDRDAADTPSWLRGFGSPTIVIDGEDVGGAPPADGASCRLYEDGGRLVGAPSVERIAARLRSTRLRPTSR
ncbi:MAG: hypothetical protein HYV09_16660 [Deltaproteobacteria bacterium]|nr:hypothetical protein [Deltaproteobacteria bacterium]